jgi:hypothetical protein
VIDDAFAALDAANAQDPNVTPDGPRALVQGRRASAWLARLAPDADARGPLALAVRAHHLRRWAIPRAQYPDGRAGYLRWRRDLKAVHAAALAEVLEPVGVSAAVIERAQQLVRKDGLGADPDAQAFEDVVCLVFLETQYAELIDRLGDDEKMVEVLRKTLPKMSDRGRALAADIALSERGAALLARAAAEVGPGERRGEPGQ